MKNTVILLGSLIFVVLGYSAFAADEGQSMKQMMHHGQMPAGQDERISLGLSAPMRQHQLMNMRSHVQAVQSIVGLLSTGAFAKASAIAHARLGLTDEMKMMCNRFDNERFRNLGLAFHESGDKLGDVLLAGDVGESLQALHTTMGYCVECHSTFRQ